MKTLMTLMILLFSLSCSTNKTAEEEVIKAVSDIHSWENENLKGIVVLEEKGNAVDVAAVFEGLSPYSSIRLDVYEKGVCIGPYYESSGQRIEKRLGKVSADREGKAMQETMIKINHKEALDQLVGKSIVVHIDQERVACGLIKPVESVL